MNITQLRTMHVTNPLGFAMEQPVLSWVVSQSSGKKQQSARVIVAADEALSVVLHDSGEGNLSSLGYTVPMALAPRTRYYWQVSVTADDGDHTVSEVAWFETGKRDEPWLGQWIAMPGDKDVHPVLKKAFAAAKPVQSARLYIAGLGLYEATINGQPVCDEYLAPYYDSYDHLVQYQTWDVTALIKENNELSVMLGNGWYKGRFGFQRDLERLYGDQMKLIVELHVAYADGTEDVIVTDESWQCRPAPVTFSSILDGEIYDARLETQGEWVSAVSAPASEGRLHDRISPAVRVTEELPVAELLHTPAGELVLDFGQVVTGWTTFHCDLPLGEKVYLQYGELLQNDCFYNVNLRTAKAEHTYISCGKPVQVRPHFTFYGFRYLKVEGMTEEQILAANFTAQVIHSDLDTIGAIETEDPRINRLIANARWSQRDNFLDIPTDCPQRDERMGWTGDAQAFCPTANYNMYTPAFYRKYLINMLEEQGTREGGVPYVVPDFLRKIRRFRIPDAPATDEGGSCAWGDAATIIPWTVYQFYGDKALLAETYPNMKGWTDWIHQQDVQYCGGRYLWTCGFHFADWLALDNPEKNSAHGGTDRYYIASAYYYRSAFLTAKAAKVLGYEEDATYYADLAEKVKAAFQEEFFTRTGRCAAPTQTAITLALCWDLVPEEFRQRNLNDLKTKLDARRIHLDTGFVGTSLLMPTLSRHGLHDYAVQLLLNDDFPSWLYEVKMGATTIWERWNSVMPNGLVSDTGMNSMNHYTYGSVVGWMYDTLAGLKPCEEAPGFKRAVIAPQPDARLGHIDCVYDSASGRYESHWQVDGDSVSYRIVIPFDCEAEVLIPGLEPTALPAGEYAFTGTLK